MLQHEPKMGLVPYQLTRVKPGTARNHLVPSGKAIYAHYLNLELHANQIEVRRADSAVLTPPC